MKKLVMSLFVLLPILSFAEIIDESPEEKRGVVRNTGGPSSSSNEAPKEILADKK